MDLDQWIWINGFGLMDCDTWIWIFMILIGGLRLVD